MLASRAAMLAAAAADWRGVRRAQPRRRGDFADQLGEDLRLGRVLRPLRCMMFLNCEWPAIALTTRLSEVFGRLYHFS
jgi:hypothetical protein